MKNKLRVLWVANLQKIKLDIILNKMFVKKNLFTHFVIKAYV